MPPSDATPPSTDALDPEVHRFTLGPFETNCYVVVVPGSSDCWIVDALRMDPHPTHSHFARTLDWIRRVAPRRAILTHMNQAMDYQTVADLCPPGVEPGYDGLVAEGPEPSAIDRGNDPTGSGVRQAIDA